MSSSVVKNPPANARDRVQSLGQKDSLKKEVATHSSMLASEAPWTEGPGGLQFVGSQRFRHNLATENIQMGQSHRKLVGCAVQYIH